MHPRFYHFSLLATMLMLALISPTMLENHLKVAGLIAQAQTTQGRKAEALQLFRQGKQQIYRGQFREALQTFQQVLVIVREIGEQQGEGATLNNIGLVYRTQGQYGKALDFYQQALTIEKAVGDRTGKDATLNNIGGIYRTQGQYGKALDFYQQALTIEKAVGDRAGKGATLSNIGGVYGELGQYDKALGFYQQALTVQIAVGDRARKGTVLGNIGEVYEELGQYGKALNFYQQALTIARAVGDRAGKGTILSNIGGVYGELGQYDKALGFYQQALTIARAVGDRVEESRTLNNIGGVYSNQGEYGKALNFYQQALAIMGAVGNRKGEGVTLSNIGYLLEKQKQQELAIVFYKQSINLREEIRQGIRTLPREQQQSYTKTVADTYRSLADLLLKQNRVLEAQQVLDLLKVQELEDYLHHVRGTSQSVQGVPLLPTEQQIVQHYDRYIDRAIPIEQELAQLKAVPENQRTPAQQQRLNILMSLDRTFLGSFTQFSQSAEVQHLVAQLSQQDPQQQSLNLSNLNNLRHNLQKFQQVLHHNAVVLYPLILKDRLELVLVTPDAPPIHRSVPVKEVDLNYAISALLGDLKNPNSQPQPNAQKLYNWLIKPIELELAQAKAQTIFYAPDDQLRYIPLAALHDGHQYLVERFQVDNIISANLLTLEPLPPFIPHVLAGAFANVTRTVSVGDRRLTFQGLQFAGKEVSALAKPHP